MQTWWLLLRDLFLFRRGPADAPYSSIALLTLATLASLIDTASHPLRSLESQPLAAVMHVLLGLLLTRALLAVHRHSARFVQTATADLLVHAPVAALTLVLLSLVGPIPTVLTPESFRPEFTLLIITLPLTLWYVVVRTRIFAQALEVPALRAFGLLVLIFIAQAILTAPFLKVPE